MHPRRRARLKTLLDTLYLDYGPQYLRTSALAVPRQYPAPEDQEIAGFFAAALAYGNVVQIQRSVAQVLAPMGGHPAAFIRRFEPARDAGPFRGFVHRFNRGRDLAVLCHLLRQVLDRHGSLGRFFLRFYDARDEDIGPALTRFAEAFLSLDVAPFYRSGQLPAAAGVRFFFPSPAHGSACKRLCLYLRWMVRRGDALDFGLWREVAPAKLVIPLDTHVARVCRRLGLTRLATTSWRMAQEVTRNLRELDPEDPVKYDYALCRYGMLERFPRRRLPG